MGVEEEEEGCPELVVVGRVEMRVQGEALAPALARSESKFLSGVSQDIQALDPCQR